MCRRTNHNFYVSLFMCFILMITVARNCHAKRKNHAKRKRHDKSINKVTPKKKKSRENINRVTPKEKATAKV